MEPNSPEQPVPPATPPATNPAPDPANNAGTPRPVSPIAQQFSEPPDRQTASTGASAELPGAFSLFKPSWQALKLNLPTWIKILVLPLLAAGLLAAVLDILKNNENLTTGFAIVFIAAVLVYAVFMGPAYLFLQVQSARGVKSGVKEVIQAARHYFWRFYGVSICAGGLVLIGLVLLIVPGLILLRRFFLAPYVLIDRDGGVFDTLRHSSAVSQINKGAVWGVIGVQVLLGFIGIIPLIGQIVSGVLNVAYYIAPAIRYEQLKRLADTPAGPVNT